MKVGDIVMYCKGVPDSRPENPILSQLASQTMAAQIDRARLAEQNPSLLKTVGRYALAATFIAGLVRGGVYLFDNDIEETTFKDPQGNFLQHKVKGPMVVTLGNQKYRLVRCSAGYSEGLMSLIERRSGMDIGTLDSILAATKMVNGFNPSETSDPKIQEGKTYLVPVPVR